MPFPCPEPTSVWQDLDLEKDVLLEILHQLDTVDKVKLCSVSQSWKTTIEASCNPWHHISVDDVQASSGGFAHWIGSRRRLITSFTVAASPVTERHPSCGARPDCGARPYIQQLNQLQTYRDGGVINVSTLRDLQPSVQHLEADMLRVAYCGINLQHLTQLTSLQVFATAPILNESFPQLDWLDLPESCSVLHLTSDYTANMSIATHWSGAYQGLRHLHLSSICSQAQVDAIVQCINLEHLSVGISDNQARVLLDGASPSYKLDVSQVKELQKLQTLDLTLVSCYLVNAQYIQCLPALEHLSVSMDMFSSGHVAVLFQPEEGTATDVHFALQAMQHVKLQMHSVFDVTDCLEGLQLVGTLRSLHVVLTQSTSRNPSEAHWAIKAGSVLARAVSLECLKVECTSMLIKCLPPQLKALHISARKVNIVSDLRLALSRLDACVLDAKEVNFLL